MEPTADAATAVRDAALPDASAVRGWRRSLGGSASGDAAAIVELLSELERLKATAAAAQARLALELDRALRTEDATAPEPRDRRAASVAAQVALARAESPHRGRTLVGAARAWVHELPHTYAAMRAGVLSEYRALLVVQHTAHLPLEARQEVDRLVCADQGALAGLGTHRLVGLVRRHGARLDPAAAAARARKAEHERTVTLRPAPDTMTYLTALLPVAQGVAVLAALRRAADAARAAGDPRSRGQVMADVLVARVTGQETATDVPLSVSLVVSDATLFGAGHEPGHVDGYGPVPAQVARNLVAHGLDSDAVWLRRVYADPAGDLLATTSAARFHPSGLADLLRVRDQGLCRTPYCDAPARHVDHVLPAGDGGRTDLENGQGLCEACNHVKQAAGWAQRTVRDESGRHRVVTTTPTGRAYTSTAPPAPVPAAPGLLRSTAAGPPAEVAARPDAVAAPPDALRQPPDTPTPGRDAPTSGRDAPMPGRDAPMPGRDAPTSGPDAPMPGPDAPTSGPDAPTPGPDPAIDPAGAVVDPPDAVVERAFAALVRELAELQVAGAG
jgi:hypothetical protein